MMRYTGTVALVVMTGLCVSGCDGDETRLLDGPMPSDELLQYQGCENADECVASYNGPRNGCDCRGPGSTGYVAINSAFQVDFSSRFEHPEIMCDVECPTYEDKFWSTAFVLDCVDNLCEILEHRDSTGRSCDESGTSDCPDGYVCETNNTDYPPMACLFEE